LFHKLLGVGANRLVTLQATFHSYKASDLLKTHMIQTTEYSLDPTPQSGPLHSCKLNADNWTRNANQEPLLHHIRVHVLIRFLCTCFLNWQWLLWLQNCTGST